jgi:rubredoxin
MVKYRKYECTVCFHIYDEELGDPDDGIAPGTLWEDIPDDWVCPICSVGKEDFVLIEEDNES